MNVDWTPVLVALVAALPGMIASLAAAVLGLMAYLKGVENKIGIEAVHQVVNSKNDQLNLKIESLEKEKADKQELESAIAMSQRKGTTAKEGLIDEIKARQLPTIPPNPPVPDH